MITPLGVQEIRLPVPGRHNIANALAAAAACAAVGVSLSDIAAGLMGFTPLFGRTEILSLGGKRTLIRDCYNANPQSMAAALEILASNGKGLKTLALLADMAELGESAGRLHAEVGRTAARLGIGRLVFVGSHGEAFVQGFIEAGGAPDAITWTRDKDEAWKIIGPHVESFGAILVKGSRVMKMETLAEQILKEN